MKTHFYLSLFLFLFSIRSVLAQEINFSNRFCPKPSTEQIEDINKIVSRQKQLRTFSSSEEKIYKIPIVVHVIHNTKSETIGGTTNRNITDEQILSQIKILNEDYRRMNADTVNTPDNFKGVAVDTKIEFCLAQLDPDGNPTTGITRDYSSQFEFDYVSDDATLKKINYWDSGKYLNIWICRIAKFKGDVILGYSTFPNFKGTGLKGESMNDPLTDGVVIDYRFFGNTGTAIYEGYNGGRTTVHEVGHYLGLLHTFDDSGYKCFADNDYCDDTPIQDTSTNADDLTNMCASVISSGCGEVRMYQNYLDYTPDYCLNMFTADQKFRMRTVLELSSNRHSLLSSHGCCIDKNKIVSIPYYENFEIQNEVNSLWNSSESNQNFAWKWQEFDKSFTAVSESKNQNDTSYLESPLLHIIKETRENPILEFQYAYSSTNKENTIFDFEYELGCSNNWYTFDQIIEKDETNSNKSIPFSPSENETITQKYYMNEYLNQDLNIIRFRFKTISQPDQQVFINSFKIYPNSKSLSSKIYPNPTTGVTYLEFILDENQTILTNIYSTSGKLVQTTQFNSLSETKSFDLTDLQSGLYFLEIIAQGQKQVHKIVKY